MTFSMPSPVELIQLVIQYQRKVGTPSASNWIRLGATTPAPGSSSSASTFRSAIHANSTRVIGGGGGFSRGGGARPPPPPPTPPPLPPAHSSAAPSPRAPPAPP